MRTYNFKSILHSHAKTWADAGPLKVKNPVNTVNLKRNLKSNPLIIFKIFYRCQILIARAFERCKAT